MFREGDIVIPHRPTPRCDEHVGLCWIDDMDCMDGNPYEILFIDSDGWCKLRREDGSHYWFLQKWLEPEQSPIEPLSARDIADFVGGV